MGKIVLILKQLSEFVPIVGDVVDNVKSKDGGVGSLLKPRMVKQIIRLALTLIAFYLLIKGDIAPEQVDEFINSDL